MDYGGHFGLAAGLDVRRTPHDHLGNGQAANQSGEHIAGTLCQKLSIGWGYPLFGIQFVRRLNT